MRETRIKTETIKTETIKTEIIKKDFFQIFIYEGNTCSTVFRYFKKR